MPPTKVERDLEKLAKTLSQQYQDGSSIERSGDKLIVPERMTLKEAVKAINEFIAAQEEEQNFQVEFECQPFDGMVCFYRAISATFGTLLGQSTETFFGTKPAKSYNVKTGPHETQTIPYGATSIPGLPIQMSIMPNFETETIGSLRVVFTCARKYEPVVREIEKLTYKELKEHSIFKGKAINSKYGFLDLDGFDDSQLVYKADVGRQINANILSPIKDSDTWRANHMPLKRGILLSGPYGTGKTLTALHTARVCFENGWTFINVIPGDNIMTALTFARNYQPAVVFFEDIDQQMGGDRDDELNQILNTVDGVVGKSDEIITILTTNHLEKINRAMLRPGRLDSIVVLSELDEPAILQLVQANLRTASGESLLHGELNGSAIYEKAQGYTPAFVKEAVVKAKAYAMSNVGDQRVTSENIEDALMELRPQFELMQDKQVVSRPTADSVLRNIMDEALEEVRNAVI